MGMAGGAREWVPGPRGALPGLATAPCPIKAIPSAPVTGGAGHRRRVSHCWRQPWPEEHPWLCCPQHHLGDLGLRAAPQLTMLPHSPCCLCIPPPPCLSFPGRVALAHPLAPSGSCRDLATPTGSRGHGFPHGGHQGTGSPPPVQPAPSPAAEGPGMWAPMWQGCRAGTALDHLLLRRDG